jgi:hypothetical protein
MKIYIVTYDDALKKKMSAQRRFAQILTGESAKIRIKAGSLEEAQKKAFWGLRRKVINVREETEAERRQLRRERARYHDTLEGTLKDIGFSEAQIEEIKKRDEQRKQQEKQQRKEQRKKRSPVEINITKARTLLRRIGLTDDQIKPYLVELRRKLTTEIVQ